MIARVLLVSLALLVPLAAGSHPTPPGCGSKGHPALGIVEVTGGTAETTVYVDDRNQVFGNGIWLYAEANGVWTPKPAGVYAGDAVHDDLQRGGTSPIVPDDVELCVDDPRVSPDLFIL